MRRGRERREILGKGVEVSSFGIGVVGNDQSPIESVGIQCFYFSIISLLIKI